MLAYLAGLSGWTAEKELQVVTDWSVGSALRPLLKWAYFGDYQNPPHIDLRSLRQLRTRYLTMHKNDPRPAIMPDIMETFIV